MARIRRKSKGKYIARRILLALAAVALLCVASLLAYRFLGEAGGNIEESSAQESASDAQSLSEPELSEESPKPPEPESEPEPEPEEPRPDDSDDSWRLILASAVNPLPQDYAPPELETVAPGYQMDSRAAPSLIRMINDARLEGITLMVCSAYRSEEKQRQLYENKVQEHKDYGYEDAEAVAAAATIVLPPGTSEHQTGLALDIVTPSYQVLDDGFAETPAAKWMAANSWKYGFILRYPEDKQEVTKIIYEPWHFRYVGEEHAKAIYDAGVCLEEYIYGVINPRQTDQKSS